MTTQWRVGDRYSNSRQDYILHETEILSQEAAFTCDLLKQFGIIAGTDNGEDSSGRAKMTYVDVDFIVDRAVSISEKAFARFREKGWITDGPSIDDLWPKNKDDE